MSDGTQHITADFKAISSTSNGKNDSIKNGRTLCYVCGGNGAEWQLYSKENGAAKGPYFPFLDTIEKAEGARPIRSNGRIDACTLCFSFLVQQWHSYEESDTPIGKRTYWLKRSGSVGNESSPLVEEKFSVNKDVNCSAAGESHEVMRASSAGSVKNSESLEDNYSDLSGLDKRMREINNERCSPNEANISSTRENENNKSLAKESKHLKSVHKGSDVVERGEVCCSCGKSGGSVPLKTVHTKPQLKTETPFYPSLAQHSKDVDFMGKVKVCKSCEVYLLKQWGNYKKQHTPLSERHYSMPSECDSQKEDKFVCFICGKEHPKKSGQNVRATRGKFGGPYFPFLQRCLPPAGARTVTETGVLKVCELCSGSLTNQWNAFEEARLPIHEREYDIEKQHRSAFKKKKATGTCSMCRKLKSDDQMDYIYGDEENTTMLTDRSKRIPVCFSCKKILKQNKQHTSVETSQKLYNNDKELTREPVKNNHKPGEHIIAKQDGESFSSETCFLCGEKVNALNLEYLYVFPRQYVNGFKPFFPSLAYRVPAYHAKPPSASGTVITCTYCHGNMINQWHECEKHEQHGISNPWVRQYFFSQFTCYLCGKIFPRQKVTMISQSDFPFLINVRRPARGFCINKKKDYVVCQHCKEIVHVQKENFDKCDVHDSERDYELPMVQFDAKPLKRKAPEIQESSHPVVVIGDSEPEGDDGEVLKREERTSVTSVVTSSRTLANTGGSHVNTTPASSAPMSSPASGAQNSSFAAALRKLAKQAMSPGSQSSVSVLPPPANPTMSPVKSNGCESPKLNGTPTVCKKEVPDPSYLNSKENRVNPNLPSSSEQPGIPGSSAHQVVPGVFSLGHRGHETRPGCIEDLHGAGRVQDLSRVRAIPPPHQSHPFYMPFLQRPAMPDSMYLPAHPFPYYSPPTMMEPPGLLPPGFDHELWRKRRALEHLRQQHERHAQFIPPHDRPLYIMEQDHLKPLSIQATMSQRPFPGDLPPRGEKNLGKSSPRLEATTPSESRLTTSSISKEMAKTSEVLGSRSPSSRAEPFPVSSSYLRQSHTGSTPAPVIMSAPHSPTGHQAPLKSPSRDSAHTERENERENIKDSKQREHQILWTRKMFEQKRRLRQEEIEWQHRQQQVRQQKREVQQELYQFRQKLLQQKESEKDDTSKKEQDKQEQREEIETRWQPSSEGIKERGKEGQRVSPENKMGLPYGYPIYHESPVGPQPLHMSSMFSHPRLPHHEMFYPSGYLPQAPLPPRVDTRMYKEYLQQPTHFVHDNKAVSEWLEKHRHPENYLAEESRDRLSSSSMFINGEVDKPNAKYKHEPQKLKFMKDLGLMTVSDKQERPQSMFVGAKRKFTDDLEAIQDEHESNKENRVENGDVSADPGTKKGNVSEEEMDSAAYGKKEEFLFNVGLVTHRKRQELEDNFEKNRWERRTQRLQRKTKKTKKEKKEEKNRSRTPLDLDVSGPMTRQKQQLLQEYGLLLPIKDAMEKESSSSSPDSTATADRDSGKEKDTQGGQAKKSKKTESPTKEDNEGTFRNTYEVSTPTPRPSPSATSLSSGPQLTLQSLTHMENPYRAFPSAFHPPFYHSGLLSVRQDSPAKNPRMFHGRESPKGTEASASSVTRSGSKSYPAVVPGNIGVYRGNGAETRPSWTLTDEPLRWPGTRKVIQSYLAYHQEQENEFNISKERDAKLRLENSSLSKESERLNSTYSELLISKQKLEEDQDSLNGRLERLRNFMVFVQNR